MVDDKRATVNAVGWVFGGLCTLVVGLRVYARAVVVKKFGWDDGLMVLAWAFAIVTTSLVTYGTTFGFAMHITDIHDKSRMSQAMKWTWLPPTVSLFSTLAAKVAMVAFLMRLLGNAVKLWHKIVLYGSLVILVGFDCLSWGVMFSYCHPLERAWTPWLPGTCGSQGILDIVGRVVSVYNAFVDLLCAGFAVVLVSTLNMKRSTKMGLVVLMGGGIFGTAASIVKIVVMGNIKDTKDMTWAYIPIAIWYLAEMHIIIIAASIPMLRPIWSRRGAKDEYSSSNKNTYGTDGSKRNRFGAFSGGQRSAPGQYTVALDELDDNEARNGTQWDDAGSHGGSSVENILPKGVQPATGVDENGIRITNEVHVGYSETERAHMARDKFNGGRMAQHHAFSRSGR